MKKVISSLIIACAAITASAAPSILSLKHSISDNSITYPESFETDTHKMLQNWYLQNYTVLDTNFDKSQPLNATDEVYIKRLSALPTTIEMPYNQIVRSYINMYTQRKRELVEAMLGMSLYYMPIFEQALERHGVPLELRYLPVIESALNPDAVSKAGATGLWQFMLPTARGLGMEISTLVDERRDPHVSSEAAAVYLKQLYNMYGDWSLAIAAYNCGPGNVNKAMRRAGEEGKDFWTIYPYLPAETRGYVPCFIAATYVMNYYHKHNISPALAKRPIITDSVHVNQRVHFNQIADVLHIPVEELQILNPQYRKQEIPGDIRPYPLVLPATQTCSYVISEKAIASHDAGRYARRDVVEPSTGMEPRPDTVDGQEGEWVTTEVVKYHKVRRKETMASIARKYGVTLRSLKRANGNIRKPRRGQTLKVVTTKREFRPYETTPPEGDNLLVKNPEMPACDNGAENNETTAATDTTAMVGNMAPTDSINGTVTPENASEQADTTTTTKVADTFRNSKAKQESAAATAKKDNAKPAASKKQKNKNAKNAAAKTHTVRRGESLYKIAKRNGTTVEELLRLNNLKNDKLQIGDKIRVK